MQEGGALAEALTGVGVTAARTEELIMQQIEEIKRRLQRVTDRAECREPLAGGYRLVIPWGY